MTAPPSSKGKGFLSHRGPAGQPSRWQAARNVLFLVLAAMLFGLLLCEGALRLFTHYGAQPGAGAATSGKLDDNGLAVHYVAQLGAASGTDRKWFTEDPPPLPSRSAPSAKQVERYKDYENRGLFPPQCEYVWNRYYVEAERCAPDTPFRNFPAKVMVFDPPSMTIYPHYRFRPNTTAVDKLVTNEFGLRGSRLALAKPPGTVRIAFLGASTTIGFHYFAFSYPERVVYWLNRFAAANHYNIRFEALNGGREGLNSHDTAQILKDELLPLAPDLAVYYEGANQFAAANDLVTPRIPPRRRIDPRDPTARHKVPEFLRVHFALGDLTDRAMNRFYAAGEPLKPAYRLQWPAGVDEQRPDADNPKLPLQLPEIVRDLDSIRTDMASIGGRLNVSSFEWLAEDGMSLSANRHKYIYEQLNTVLWPLRYHDIRRLADFQNRVLRRYAQARGLDFLDVAAAIPQDPELFIDAIHMTEAGERIRAWITFQQLVPILRREIESGRLPRAADPGRLPPPPSLAVSEATVRCGDAPAGPLLRVDGALSLATLGLGYQEAQIHYGHPIEIVTADLPSSHAAVLPFYVPPNLPGPAYAFLRGRVTAGRVGIGVLETVNGKHTDPQFVKMLAPALGTIDVYIPLVSPRFDAMVISNAAQDRTRSTFLIEDAAVMAAAKAPPLRLLQTIDLGRVRLADPKASLSREKRGLLVTTKAERNSYAGRLSLGLDAGAGAGLSAHIWAHGIAGTIGFGILSADSQSFLLQRCLWPSAGTIDVILPLPPPTSMGDLVLFNSAPEDVPSKALVEKIEIRKAP